MTDTQDVDALKVIAAQDNAGMWLMPLFQSIGLDEVEGLRRYYTDAVFKALCHKAADIADLARKAVPDTQEGYDCAMPHIHGLMRRDPSPFDPFPTHYDPCPTCSYKLKCEALEAALTTANERVRVLEGVAEWLAQHIAGWNKQDHADHGISTWTENESLDYWLAAAHEAVKKAHDDRRG